MYSVSSTGEYALIFTDSPIFRQYTENHYQINIPSRALVIINDEITLQLIRNTAPDNSLTVLTDSEVLYIRHFLATAPPVPPADVRTAVSPELSEAQTDFFRSVKDSPGYGRAAAILAVFTQNENSLSSLISVFLRDGMSFAERIVSLIEQDMSFPWKQEDIARLSGISTSTLRRKLHEEGCSFSRLLTELRMKKAIRLLENSDISIGSVTRALGYRHESWFVAAFRKYHGITPKQYQIKLRKGKKRPPLTAGDRSGD